MRIIKLSLLAILLTAISSHAVTIGHNLSTTTTTVPGAAAAIDTDSCSGADCVSTSNCPANSIIVFAYSREDSATCTGVINNTTTSGSIRLDCIGATSCAETEVGLGNVACTRIMCAGN